MKAAITIQRISGSALRAILVVALVLGITPTAAAQSAKGKSDGAGAPASAKARAAAKPSGGRQEGIKVHGHWVIDIRNPDGTLASHHEFENALASGGGDQLLALLLAHKGNPGRWELSLAAAVGGVSPCEGGTGGRFANWCRIIESDATNPTGGNAESKDLNVVVGTGFTVIMQGTITALVNGAVGRVSTSLGLCAPSDPTAVCHSAGWTNLFTDAFPAPIAVVASQIMQVKVTLSFS